MPNVGKASEIASGQMTCVEVGGERMVIANVGGVFHGISDTCTHRGCSLSEGTLGGTVVTCPCHGGQFDVTTGMSWAVRRRSR